MPPVAPATPPKDPLDVSPGGRGGESTGCGGGGEGGGGGGGGEVTMAPAPSSQWSGLGHMVAEDTPDAEFGVEGSGVTTRLLARLPLHSLSPLSQ